MALLADASASNLTRGPSLRNPRAEYGFRVRTCSIAAVGSCVPERVLSNAELARQLTVTEDWILRRTGIRERRIADANESTSVMATWAATHAMAKAGVLASDVELIIVATSTPDMMFPSTACLVQAQIGARRAAAFDIGAGGSGFLYALEVGHHFIASHAYDTVLAVGADKLSAVVDWQDRNTCVLFGDGAGAAVLRGQPQSHGLVTTCMGSDGGMAGLLSVPGGGSRYPTCARSVEGRLHFLRMDGKETFKQAVKAMETAAQEALRLCELDLSQIKCIIPHQANRRILEALAERLGASPGQMFVNVEKYGNTSAASVPIALNEAVDSGQVQRGDFILLIAFGAGLTWAAAVIEW